MKKKLFFLALSGMSCVLYSQVGIETNNPQGSFHVDGAKDNATSGAPTTAQQDNDFIVTATGNTGIGTTSPTAKLHLNNPTQGAIRITDGSQADGRILTSDANGLGTWKAPAFSSSIEGTWLINNRSASTNNSVPVGTFTSIAKLTLPSAGTYLVFLNADFGMVNGIVPGSLQYLVTKGPVTNAANLAGAIGAIPGTWNTIYNSVIITMGAFTINNTFFITTTGSQDLYLTVLANHAGSSNTGVILQRWGNIAESPAYGSVPGGLAIDRFVAYKF